MQYLTFHLNGVGYAVDVTIVETVVDYGGITMVPSPLAYMKGVMDLRGRIIPIIDLRRKFGLPESVDLSRASIIVFTLKDSEKRLVTVGAIVDEVSGVANIDEREIEVERCENVSLWESYILGVARLKESMLVVIDAAGLFSISEIMSLQEAGANQDRCPGEPPIKRRMD
jgi:purine-binding chemotaxis protein CheW